ncbi:MAG: hypothetical protein A3G47_02470 [Candidatus Zambryskibacteria bacterium RIFCSPLOWO2_12_FULL_39_45]|uniref:Uncharacterized protein n=1 Tax=Candidatus Zambryskibacteria bacterium RIFCSPHIGHO2_12_FULL_38_37 TaxID=1802751 RepID=A0A1G2TKN4_9BACT|nr:MAG: hypothetical protein A3E32_01025 [Candidatus Zambryskibacteria bacterium RIFCSPHIGHO2_12_FULL_38_37]OHB14220.1 MAG: hypothetical protein A3G47_02470 [Candidatus Zambryskibacteria bacterium RIFCSPLOWO2_12_FULL_39_45]
MFAKSHSDMEKLKQYKYIILLAVLLFGFTFYWFQIRPTQIIKGCIKDNPKAFETPRNTDSELFRINNLIENGLIDTDKTGYQKCLREQGLKM